jgi:hypothetical protein
MKSTLLTAWSNWTEQGVPYILEEDRHVLESLRSSKAITTFTSWPEVYSAEDFAAPGDTRLQLGLLPHPFCGDLKNAEIYILMLNPGYGPHDYYGEYEVPKYRQAVLANLKQIFNPDALPFFLLDPKFSWHGGFTWWHRKFAKVIEELAKLHDVTYAEARAELAGKIASIELLPYHSTSFRDGDGWVRQLDSAMLAREFVHDYVMPKVENGKAIVIVTRQAKVWNLPTTSGVIRYTGTEARGAYLTPHSHGGRAILNRLK